MNGKSGRDNIDRLNSRYLDILASFSVKPEDLPEDLKGKKVHIPQVNFDVPMEKQVQARMGPPPYAIRARMIEDIIERLHSELEKQWKAAARHYEDDPKTFARVWKAVIETMNLSELNDLVKEHNTFYPIEANLREHPDTGQLMIGATPWKPKKKMSARDLLEKFPPDLEAARAAAEEG